MNGDHVRLSRAIVEADHAVEVGSIHAFQLDGIAARSVIGTEPQSAHPKSANVAVRMTNHVKAGRRTGVLDLHSVDIETVDVALDAVVGVVDPEWPPHSRSPD